MGIIQLIVFIVLLPTVLWAEDDKINICNFTVNSSDEKEVFTKHLSTGTNAGKFNFIEFTKTNSEDPNWLEKSCKSETRCDVLIISGHFGGSSFFDDEGTRSLLLNKLEQKSCEGDCDNILNSPKEVFLFGCNTLSSKGEDSRTPQEYLEILLEHNVPYEEAIQGVEQRYGVGSSNKEIMQRIFKNVPRIYGFNSTGPRGHTVRPLLEKYHRKIPDYHQHLTQIELERGLAMMGQFDQWNAVNNHWDQALSNSARDLCAGAIDVGDPNPVFQKLCGVRNEQIPTLERLKNTKELLLDENLDVYLDTIGDFLSSIHPDYLSEDERQVFKSLKESEEIQNNFEIVKEQLITDTAKLRFISLGYLIGIYDEDKLREVERDYLLKNLKYPISTAMKDRVCGYMNERNYDSTLIKVAMNPIKLDDIDRRVVSSNNGIMALNCIGFRDPEAAPLIKRRISMRLLDQWTRTDVADSDRNIAQFSAIMLYAKIGEDKSFKTTVMNKLTRAKGLGVYTASAFSVAAGFSTEAVLKLLEKSVKNSDEKWYVLNFLQKENHLTDEEVLRIIKSWDLSNLGESLSFMTTILERKRGPLTRKFIFDALKDIINDPNLSSYIGELLKSATEDEIYDFALHAAKNNPKLFNWAMSEVLNKLSLERRNYLFDLLIKRGIETDHSSIPKWISDEKAPVLLIHKLKKGEMHGFTVKAMLDSKEMVLPFLSEVLGEEITADNVGRFQEVFFYLDGEIRAELIKELARTPEKLTKLKGQLGGEFNLFHFYKFPEDDEEHDRAILKLAEFDPTFSIETIGQAIESDKEELGKQLFDIKLKQNPNFLQEQRRFSSNTVSLVVDLLQSGDTKITRNIVNGLARHIRSNQKVSDFLKEQLEERNTDVIDSLIKERAQYLFDVDLYLDLLPDDRREMDAFDKALADMLANASIFDRESARKVKRRLRKLGIKRNW